MKVFGMFAAAVLLAVSPAMAAETTVDVGVTSDYVKNGLSLSDESVAVQAGVTTVFGNDVYVGAQATTLTDSVTEVSAAAGVRPTWNGFDFDLGVKYNAFVGNDADELNYGEVTAGVSRAFGPARVGFGVTYSPDFLGLLDETYTYQTSASYAVTDRLVVSGTYGVFDIDAVDANYDFYNVGAAYNLTDALALDVRYHNTNLDIQPAASERVVLSLKASF